MKRIITAAEAEKDTRFDDSYSILEDDFSYLLEGLEKLDRENATLEALQIMETLREHINEAISQVADNLPSSRKAES